MGHGLVAWNLLLNELNHAAFSAGMDFFSNSIEVAGFYLASLGAIASRLAAESKHRAARGKAERNGD